MATRSTFPVFRGGGLVCAAVALLTAAAARTTPAENMPPVVEHSPVPVAVQGQSLVVRARVTDDSKRVKTVTLFFTASRDAAPIKVPMQNVGADIFSGAIPVGFFAGIPRFSYYIEARDDLDAASETAWHSVEIKSLDIPPAPAAVTNAPAAVKKSGWLKSTLTTGGALLAGGAIAALVIKNNDKADGSTPVSPITGTNSAGVYKGTVTTCYQPPTNSISCWSHATTITINGDLSVASDDLMPGQQLRSSLSGGYFVLTADAASTSGGNGEILYVGTLVDRRIVGSIQGTATTSDGTGNYSGTFSAVRQ